LSPVLACGLLDRPFVFHGQHNPTTWSALHVKYELSNLQWYLKTDRAMLSTHQIHPAPPRLSGRVSLDNPADSYYSTSEQISHSTHLYDPPPATQADFFPSHPLHLSREVLMSVSTPAAGNAPAQTKKRHPRRMGKLKREAYPSATVWPDLLHRVRRLVRRGSRWSAGLAPGLALLLFIVTRRWSSASPTC